MPPRETGEGLSPTQGGVEQAWDQPGGGSHHGGTGVEITIRDDVLTVVSPIEGTPAFHAGIQAGDKIVTVNGESTKDLSLIEAVKKLRGPVDTSVTIGIMREGFTDPKDFTPHAPSYALKMSAGRNSPTPLGM